MTIPLLLFLKQVYAETGLMPEVPSPMTAATLLSGLTRWTMLEWWPGGRASQL